MNNKESSARGDYVENQEFNSIIFCSICKLISHDPVSFGCKLRLVYCRSCVTHNVNASCCIACKKTDSDCPMNDNKMAAEIIAECLVYCLHKNNGCSWQGEKQHLEDHIEKECKDFFCTQMSKGCSWKGMKSGVDEHNDVCLYAIVPCPHGCDNSSIIRMFEKEHDETCQVLKDRLREEQEQREAEARRQKEEVEERKRMERAKREKERQEAQEAIAADIKEQVVIHNEGMIRINVGGKLFVTSGETLTAGHLSILSESQSEKESDTIFLDRNPHSFALMLQYLRYGSASAKYLNRKDQQLLLVEAIFWCIQGLAEEIMRALELDNNNNILNVEISSLCVQGRNYNEWRWRKVSFVDCNFNYSSFDGGDLSKVLFSNCSLKYCSAKNTKFCGTQLTQCDLGEANLERAIMSDAIIHNTDFTNAIATGCRFPTNMSSCNLSGCELGEENCELSTVAQEAIAADSKEQVVIHDEGMIRINVGGKYLENH